ncbi:MAG: penicillin-binding protein 2 [Thermodesulfovibrionales bacterium]|nr:penicillin-binding protein 2 [Thermodesulfovibrionales bacterium]
MARKLTIASYLIIAVFVIIILRLWQLQILEGDRYKKLSETNRLRIIKTPAPRGIIYDRNGIPLVKNVPFFSVLLSPDAIDDIDLDALARLLNMSKEELSEKVNRKDISPFVPIKLKMGISFEEVARIEAHKSDFQGLFVETEVGRQYLFGKTASHLIGYLGKIKQSQISDLKDFPADALIGQWGAEAVYDKELRGTPGGKVVEIDAIGRELRLISENQPVKGKDIYLSIDIRLHKAIHEAFGNKAGAVVAFKVDTGEILALESLPSFDPNLFAKGISNADWQSLINDPKKPMLNRALQSQYPPGSTFKMITALAALEEDVVKTDWSVNCTGGLTYGSWTFGCWKKGGHGGVNFHRAIVESCDVYFYEIGKRLGIEKIHKYATAFGLGKETGINLTPVVEKKGLIPNAKWKSEVKKLQWYLGDTFISSIGQGFVLATPIQMARMTAAIVNGGYLISPTLLKDEKGQTTKIDVSDDNLNRIKMAMAGVVNEGGGTARTAMSSIVQIGGKTGTSQVVGKKKGLTGEKYMDHAWFIAFAPVKDSEIALSVFVEHGGGGGAVAAPIAKRVIEAYYKKTENTNDAKD